MLEATINTNNGSFSVTSFIAWPRSGDAGLNRRNGQISSSSNIKGTVTSMGLAINPQCQQNEYCDVPAGFGIACVQGICPQGQQKEQRA